MKDLFKEFGLKEIGLIALGFVLLNKLNKTKVSLSTQSVKKPDLDTPKITPVDDVKKTITFPDEIIDIKNPPLTTMPVSPIHRPIIEDIKPIIDTPVPVTPPSAKPVLPAPAPIRPKPVLPAPAPIRPKPVIPAPAPIRPKPVLPAPAPIRPKPVDPILSPKFPELPLDPIKPIELPIEPALPMRPYEPEIPRDWIEVYENPYPVVKENENMNLTMSPINTSS